MKKKLQTIVLAIALTMTVVAFVACDDNGGGGGGIPSIGRTPPADSQALVTALNADNWTAVRHFGASSVWNSTANVTAERASLDPLNPAAVAALSDNDRVAVETLGVWYFDNDEARDDFYDSRREYIDEIDNMRVYFRVVV